MSEQEEKPPLRRVYILPNLFTAFNMFLGLAAIYNFYLAQTTGDATLFTKGCWWIILAGVLDGVDGAVARMTNTQSSFGVEFDSLADLVSFGVAPSLAAFSLVHAHGVIPKRLLIGVCALYAICGALRLARYNIQSETATPRGGFLGLPIPAAAGGVVSFALLVRHYHLEDKTYNLLPFLGTHFTIGEAIPIIFPFCVLALALLMVSEIPYPKITSKICIKREMPFDTLVSVVLMTAVLWALSHDERVALIYVLGCVYILYGPVMALSRHSRRKAATGQTRNS